MAKRKRGRGSRIAEALGESLTNISSMMQRSMMQDRIDKRQQENNLAILDRQGENATTQFLNSLMADLAANKVTPEQVSAAHEMTGRKTPAAMAQIQPTTRRRLEDTVGKSIMEADAPEEVPGDLDIASMARTLGVGDRFPGLDPAFTEGMAPADGALADLDPIAVDFSQRATARRNALQEKPTNVVDVTNSDGSTSSRAVSLYDLANAPIQTGPTSYEKGVNEGIAETAKIYTAGEAIAGQKGAEAAATTTGSETAKMAPGLVNARVTEAARTAGARAAAELPYQIRLATERATIEARQSANADHIKNASAAAAATAKLQPFVTRFGELIDRINTGEGMTQAVIGGGRELLSWMNMDAEVSELNQLTKQNLRGIAQAMGVREAQVSDKDQEIVAAGLGITAMTGRQEASNAYRNLIDITTIAPIVAARTSFDTPMEQRMALAKQLMNERRAAENAALTLAQQQRKTGTIYYKDPVTGGVLRLIQ